MNIRYSLQTAFGFCLIHGRKISRIIETKNDLKNCVFAIIKIFVRIFFAQKEKSFFLNA